MRLFQEKVLGTRTSSSVITELLAAVRESATRFDKQAAS
jgi:hypothetical protein